MAADRTPPAPRRRLVLLLGSAAGYLDAVGYLTLGLFTANMTGNTVLLGIAIGQGRWHAAARVALAVVAFVIGAVGGALLLRRHRRLGIALGLEAVLVVAAAAAWRSLVHPAPGGGQPAGTIPGPEAAVLIALLSAAMGVQSAAVRRVGEHRVSTTYVTGTLTSLAVDAATELTARLGRVDPSADAGVPAAKGTALLLGIWATYVGGALTGGFAQQHWGFPAVAVPGLVLAILAAWDTSRPAPSSS